MMKQTKSTLLSAFAALGLSLASAHADVLLNFPFNEGSGTTTRDTANGLIGVFGTVQDPSVDTIQLVDQSPSGQAGDRAMMNAGAAFLLANDTNQVLNITNGPITMESWVFIDPLTPAGAAEGILAYGSSYKMGLRSGLQVFTLYGKVDVVNNTAGPIPAGEWVHLAAAWEPGVGVHFYVNGVESFEADTNTTARPISHNYLSLASEGFGNNSVATFDRMRIHHALLTSDQIDSVASAPKAPLASTLVSYDFDQSALPATNSVPPLLPASSSVEVLPVLTGPQWTNDSPAKMDGDYALAFVSTNPPVKEVVTVDYGDTPIDLTVNNTSYTLQAWVKLPTESMEERRVIFRSNGDAPRVALSVNANRTLHTTVIGTADFTTSVSIPNDNRWHHIAVVMQDFDQLLFYLDGVLRQTVARTQTGVPSSGGTPQLLIGKESETRYFRGLLDRVIINNDALPQPSLDYPAAPGLPTFDTIDAQPADVLTDAGSTVTFMANPSSQTAATYQWRYRTNLADHTSVALAGETSPSLTLTNITAADQGFYFLVVSNAVGAVESYGAELALRSTYALPETGFEAPAYTAGPIEGQNRWTIDENGQTARILTADQITNVLAAAGLTPGQTVHSGNQALLVSGANVSSATIRKVTGFENEEMVTLDFWARPLAAGTSGAATGNLFIALENANGTRAAAVRFGPNNSIDYGTQVSGVWQASGQTWDENSWYHISMVLDYANRTYDFLLNGEKLNTDPIPFYNAGSDQLAQIRIFRGANQAGVILDDLSLRGSGSGEAPALSIQRQGDNQLLISWPASAGNFALEATDQLVPANWTPVNATSNSTDYQANIAPTGQSRFFRLVQQ